MWSTDNLSPTGGTTTAIRLPLDVVTTGLSSLTTMTGEKQTQTNEMKWFCLNLPGNFGHLINNNIGLFLFSSCCYLSPPPDTQGSEHDPQHWSARWSLLWCHFWTEGRKCLYWEADPRGQWRPCSLLHQQQRWGSICCYSCRCKALNTWINKNKDNYNFQCKNNKGGLGTDARAGVFFQYPPIELTHLILSSSVWVPGKVQQTRFFPAPYCSVFWCHFFFFGCQNTIQLSVQKLCLPVAS